MADVNPALNTPTDLSNTRSVADALNASLADCYALYLKTKNFHWHVSGPHFRDYHLLLDDQAAQILGVTDAIAERVRVFRAAAAKRIQHEQKRAGHVNSYCLTTPVESASILKAAAKSARCSARRT